MAFDPRTLDASLAAGAALALATGLASLFAATPGEAWVVVAHGVAGLVLAGLVGLKLRRVAPRVRAGRATPTAVALTLVTLGALASGVWWVLGGSLSLGPWGLLNLHVGLGLLVVVPLVVHLRRRFRRPTAVERRDALRYAAIVGAGALVWRGQQAVADVLGAERRFTGSREEGSDAGNRFPATSWVADDPDPVDADAWRLAVTGAVAEPLELPADDLPSAEGGAGAHAVLDCTSGWYSAHDWQGVAVRDLLAAAGPTADASWVQFRSVTGYRWSLPLAEAREALLATHVDGERLSHAHGFPLRLVAPERRGFQWVKWVESVRVTRRRDRSEWVALFVSGLDE